MSLRLVWKYVWFASGAADGKRVAEVASLEYWFCPRPKLRADYQGGTSLFKSTGVSDPGRRHSWLKDPKVGMNLARGHGGEGWSREQKDFIQRRRKPFRRI